MNVVKSIFGKVCDILFERIVQERDKVHFKI